MATNNNLKVIKEEDSPKNSGRGVAKEDSDTLISLLKNLFFTFRSDNAGNDRGGSSCVDGDTKQTDEDLKKLFEIFKIKSNNQNNPGEVHCTSRGGPPFDLNVKLGKGDPKESAKQPGTQNKSSNSFDFLSQNGDLFCSVCDWYPLGISFDDFLLHCRSKNHLKRLKERFSNSSNELSNASPKKSSQVSNKIDEFLGVNKTAQTGSGTVSNFKNAKNNATGQYAPSKNSTQEKPQATASKKQQKNQPQTGKATCTSQNTKSETVSLGIPLTVSLSRTRLVGKDWVCSLCNKAIPMGLDLLVFLNNANTHYNSKAHLSKVTLIQEAANILSGTDRSNKQSCGKQETNALNFFKDLGVKK